MIVNTQKMIKARTDYKFLLDYYVFRVGRSTGKKKKKKILLYARHLFHCLSITYDVYSILNNFMLIQNNRK